MIILTSATDQDFAIARPTHVRFQILAAACSLAVITYIHRVGFATVSAEIKEPLGLSDQHLGYMMAAFLIGYGLFEIPWGLLGDRLGVRNTLTAIIVGGSALTACLTLAVFLPRHVLLLVAFLMLLRFGFGAFQAGTFPSISRMMADWMPTTERGKAQGTIWMSTRIGGAIAPNLLVWLFWALGNWNAPLILVSILGLAWGICFWPWYRNLPEETSRVNLAERQLIESGRAPREDVGHGEIPWVRMLRTKSVWALCLMYGFLGFSGNFYLTLLPTYLKHHRHLSSDVTSQLTSLPFALGVVACFAGGSLSDMVIRRWGKQWGRRIVGAAGMSLAGLAILAVPWVDNVSGARASPRACLLRQRPGDGPRVGGGGRHWRTLYRHARRSDEYDFELHGRHPGNRDRSLTRLTRSGHAVRLAGDQLRLGHLRLDRSRCEANAIRPPLIA